MPIEQQVGFCGFGVKFLDVMGSKFQINYPTRSGTFQTNTGALLSILVGVLVSIAFYTFLRRFMDTSSPKVSSSLEYNPDNYQFNLYDQKIFKTFSIKVGDRLLHPSELKRYVTIKAYVDKFYWENETERFKSEVDQEYDYIPCDQIKDRRVAEFLDSYFIKQKGVLSRTMCPDLQGRTDQYYAQGDHYKFKFSVVKVYIFPCSLQDPRQCASKSELNRAQLLTTNTKKSLASWSKKNPTKAHSEVVGHLEFDAGLKKFYSYSLRLNEVYDDATDYFEPRLNTRFIDYQFNYMDYKLREADVLHCTKEQMDDHLNDSCHEYFKFYFEATGEVKRTRRTYYKLFSMVADFGGVAKIIVIMATLIYTLYSTRAVKSYFLRQIYGQEKKCAVKEIIFREELKGSNAIINSHKNKSNKIHERVDSLMDSCLKENQNGVNLYQKINQMMLLEKLLFDQNAKALLPLALLKIKKDEEDKIKIKKFQSDKLTSKAKKGRAEEGNDCNSSQNKLLDYQKAFEQLKKTTPKNIIQRQINELILTTLKGSGGLSFGSKNKKSTEKLETGAGMGRRKVRTELDLGNLTPVNGDGEGKNGKKKNHGLFFERKFKHSRVVRKSVRSKKRRRGEDDWAGLNQVNSLSEII